MVVMSRIVANAYVAPCSVGDDLYQITIAAIGGSLFTDGSTAKVYGKIVRGVVRKDTPIQSSAVICLGRHQSLPCLVLLLAAVVKPVTITSAPSIGNIIVANSGISKGRFTLSH